MALTSQDVVTEDSISAMVQAQTEATYGFRRAFRDHTPGDGSGPSMKFPLTEEGFEGAMEEIPENTEYPRFEKEYGDVEAVYTKYGFEAPISDEALEDGVLDVELDNTQSIIREETRRLNAIAYGVLSANLNSEVVGNDDDNLTFDEVVDARAEHRSQEYAPDLLLVDSFGAAAILKSDAFKLRDTPVGDRAVQEGFIGAVAGLDIFETNSGQLGSNNGIMVDTSRYGYESAKDRSDVTSYREEKKDQTVYKIKDRLDWVSTDPGAALKLTG